MADSQTLADFKRAAAGASWDQAFSCCNGLSMYEMLRGLDSLSGDALLYMMRNVRNYAGRLGWERIAFAIAVVGEHAIGTFPGILPSDRSDAQTFLTQKKSSQVSPGSVAEAGRMVSEGLAAGLIQDPKRELAGALSGSGPLFVSKEIVLLLAALINGRNTIKLVSLVRPRGGPHGIPISDTEYLSQAVDIGYFNGLIDVHTTADNQSYADPNAPFRTHTAVLGVFIAAPPVVGAELGYRRPTSYQHAAGSRLPGGPAPVPARSGQDNG